LLGEGRRGHQTQSSGWGRRGLMGGGRRKGIDEGEREETREGMCRVGVRGGGKGRFIGGR